VVGQNEVRTIERERKRQRDGLPLTPCDYPKGTPMWIQWTLLQHLMRYLVMLIAIPRQTNAPNS